jgi:hypothetical protein
MAHHSGLATSAEPLRDSLGEIVSLSGLVTKIGTDDYTILLTLPAESAGNFFQAVLLPLPSAVFQ